MSSPIARFETVVRPLSDDAIADAATRIAAGECVAVPTETVYGLAADATDGEAVARIYEAKGRPSFNPLIVHVADLEAAKQVAEFTPAAERLAAAFWPGPLTLVLPRRADSPVARLVTAGLDTIAIRVPAHPAMQALLHATGVPLAAPSANASGRISPTRADHVLKSLSGRIGLVIDAGRTGLGLESTILKPMEDVVALLRAGPVEPKQIEELAGISCKASEQAEIEAPGQLHRHYAPAKPLRLDAREAGPDEWLIGFGEVAGDATLSARGDLVESAATLFERLHEAEESGKPRIAVAPVPETGLGVAINDRLRRAAA